MKNDKYDSEIADVLHSIWVNAVLEVETPAEAVLVKLFELRGTPITPVVLSRDVEQDFARYVEDGPFAV